MSTTDTNDRARGAQLVTGLATAAFLLAGCGPAGDLLVQNCIADPMPPPSIEELYVVRDGVAARRTNLVEDSPLAYGEAIVLQSIAARIWDVYAVDSGGVEYFAPDVEVTGGELTEVCICGTADCT